MANLNQPYETFERPGIVVSMKLANTKVYKGALLAVAGTGFLTQLTGTGSANRFVGVANETVDNSAGAAGEKSVTVTKSGSFVFKAASGFIPSQADIGKDVYAVTDWEVQATTSGLTNIVKVGTILAIETTSTGYAGVRVRIDNHTF